MHSKAVSAATSRIPAQSRAAGINVFRCSFAQERLWFLHQMHTDHVQYNEAIRLRASGNLDLAILNRTLAVLVERHESLRTTFALDGGSVTQRIAPQGRVPMSVVDLSHLPADAATRIDAVIQGRALRVPFDLALGPLFRIVIGRLSSTEHVIGITAHHIVCDGWSLALLLAELREIYTGYATGRPRTLAPLPAQPADVAAFERAQFDSGRVDASLAFWQQQLSGAEVLQLPADYRKSSARPVVAAVVERRLDEALTNKVKALGCDARASLFMTLITAWALALSRYSGQEDVVIGSQIANRGRAELDRLIGFVANAFALRVRIRRDQSFTHLLADVRDRCVAAYARQDAPFEKVVERLQPSRSPGANPLFTSVFTLQISIPSAIDLPGVSLSWLDPGPQTPPKFDLALSVRDDGQTLLARWRFDPLLFHPATVGRLADEWVRVLEQAVEDPQQPVAAIESRAPGVGAPRAAVASRPLASGLLLHHLFEASARKTPAALAVTHGARSLTYHEVNRQANCIARCLQQLGAGPEMVVGLLLDRHAEMIVAILGVLKSGAAYLPLEPQHPKERLEYVLRDCSPCVVLTEKSLAALVPAGSPQVVLIEDLLSAVADVESDVRSAGDPENAAYVIYTSGSTGRPKGTIVTHRNVVRLLEATESKFRFGADDTWTVFHSYAFDFSVWEIWGALAYGGRMVVVPFWLSRSPAEFHQLVNDTRVTVLNQTPSALKQFMQANWDAGSPPIPQLRYVILGGEEFNPASLQRWYTIHDDHQPEIVNMYGITETTVHVTHRVVRRRDTVAGVVSPIGTPIDDLTLHVLDASMSPVADGALGEMYVGGAGLARGYWRRPGLTASRLVPDPFGPPGQRLYRSGDRARLTGENELSYAGRIDHQVKVRGHRIELGEIEAVLTEHPGVQVAVVRARSGASEDTSLIAYWVPMAGAVVDDAALRAYLRTRLPDYMQPSALVAIPALPLTTNGKVDTNALPEVSYDTHVSVDTLRTPTEDILSGMWSQLLRHDSVGRHANFFDVGGHSLLATQLASRIREVFNVQVPLRTIFEQPTIADLAGCIDALRREHSVVEAVITPRADCARPPLSLAQQGIWFREELEPGSAYNVAKVIKLVGSLDVSSVRGAWAAIVGRHEVLRTCYPTVDGEPVQEITDAAAVRIPYVDLESLSDGACDAVVGRIITSETLRALSLANGPVWRMQLLRLSAQTHVLVLVLHHIACDGWSVGVLLREFNELYESLREGRPHALSPLPIQFADFAVWQRTQLSAAMLREQEQYWRKQLQGSVPLQLPRDHATSMDDLHPAGRVPLDLGEALTSDILRVARSEGLTPFMVLAAALTVLLSRWTGQDDVTLGTDLANRTRGETEGLIGVFVNQVVLRAKVDSHASFREVLMQIRETTLNAYARQEVPFEWLLSTMAPPASRSRAPLFQVKLVFQNAPTVNLKLADVVAEDMPLPAREAKLDLLLMLRPEGKTIRGLLEYDANAFTPSTAESLVSCYRHFLHAACAEPSTIVSAIVTSTDDEYRRMTAAFS